MSKKTKVETCEKCRFFIKKTRRCSRNIRISLTPHIHWCEQWKRQRHSLVRLLCRSMLRLRRLKGYRDLTPELQKICKTIVEVTKRKEFLNETILLKEELDKYARSILESDL